MIFNVVLMDVVGQLSSCVHRLLVRNFSCVWIMCLTNTMQVCKCLPTDFVSLVVVCPHTRSHFIDEWQLLQCVMSSMEVNVKICSFIMLSRSFFRSSAVLHCLIILRRKRVLYNFSFSIRVHPQVNVNDSVEGLGYITESAAVEGLGCATESGVGI